MNKALTLFILTLAIHTCQSQGGGGPDNSTTTEPGPGDNSSSTVGGPDDSTTGQGGPTNGTIYMVATGPGPCWSGGGCFGGFSVPGECPPGYDDVAYGDLCADCRDASCDKKQNWIDTAFHTVYTWGCPSSNPNMALTVRACNPSPPAPAHSFQTLGVQPTDPHSYTITFTLEEWSQSLWNSVRTKICLPGKGCSDKSTCETGGPSQSSSCGATTTWNDQLTFTYGPNEVRPDATGYGYLYECGWIWDTNKASFSFKMSELISPNEDTPANRTVTLATSAGCTSGISHNFVAQVIRSGSANNFTTGGGTTSTCPLIPQYNQLSANEKQLVDSFIAEDYTMDDEDHVIPTREEPAHNFHDLQVHTLPAHFDLRSAAGNNYLGPTRNQSPCGTCMSMAIAGAIEGTYKLYHLQPNAPIEVSPAWIHSCVIGAPCRQGDIMDIVHDLQDPRGPLLKSPALAIEAIYDANYGNAVLSANPQIPNDAAYAVSEGCFPYATYTAAADADPTDPTKNCQAKCAQDTTHLRTGVGQPVIETTEQRQKSWIGTHGPMVTSLKINQAFLTWQIRPASRDPDCAFSTEGHDPVIEPNYAPVGVRHAVLVVGWGITSSGTKYWIIRDSRGTTVCDAGFCKVAAGAMEIDVEMVGVELLDRYRNSTGAYEFPPDAPNADDGEDDIINLDSHLQ